MKKVLFSIFMFVAMVGCCNKPKSYLIEVSLPDSSYNGKMAYIESYAKELIIDSSMVVDGKVSFKGSVNNSDYSIIRVDENSLVADFVLEEGTINIDLSETPVIGGTYKNDEVNRLLSDFKNIPKLFEAEITQFPADMSNMERYKVENNILDKIEDDYYQKLKAVIKENPNNALGFFTLWISADLYNNIKYFDSLYVYAGDSIRNNPRIVRLMDQYSIIKESFVGNKFKDFTVPKGNLDGTDAKISDYVGKGKYILVDFWAHWCGPCHMQIPYLRAVYDKYKGDKFDVLSIAVWDKREETIAEIQKGNMPWSHIIDAQNIPINLYGIRGIPQIMLIAPDGTIVARDLFSDNIILEVDKVMAK